MLGQGNAPCSFVSIEHGCCLSLTRLPRPCSGSVDSAAGRQERLLRGRRELKQPRVHGQLIAVPRDFAQPVRHIAGEVLLLSKVRQSACPSPADVGRCRFHGRRA